MKRKIAANYISLPGFPFVKNGYVVWDNGNVIDVVDTGGQVKEIQGLEFYGGMIVPGFVGEYVNKFQVGEDLLPVLNEIYLKYSGVYYTLAILEGADLKELKWRVGTRVCKLG